jgi:hypothetical protein
MIKRIHALFALGACVALLGCSTLPAATPSGRTFIESDPPGARIEINSQYVGVTPLRVNIPRRDAEWDPISITIVASPVIPGQQVQTKYVGHNEPTPTHIFFDMSLVREKN